MSLLQTQNENRTQSVVRVLFGILVLNWLVAAVKIGLGLVANNLTVVADGFHSLLDGANNIVGIVALKYAAQPPDEHHPYGHQKFENVAAMLIGGLVMLLGWEVLEQAILTVRDHLRGTAVLTRIPAPPGVIGFGFLSATLLINLFVAWYEQRQGKLLQSTFLQADAAHTKSDIAVTGLSLISLSIGSEVWWADVVLALLVVGFIIKAAFTIILHNVDVFTDRIKLDPEQVSRVTNAVRGVLNTHAIRSHGSQQDIHLDLHIVVAEQLSAKEVADIEENVRAALQSAFSNVSLVSVHHQTDPHDPEAPLWKD